MCFCSTNYVLSKCQQSFKTFINNFKILSHWNDLDTDLALFVNFLLTGRDSFQLDCLNILYFKKTYITNSKNFLYNDLSERKESTNVSLARGSGAHMLPRQIFLYLNSDWQLTKFFVNCTTYDCHKICIRWIDNTLVYH